MCVLEGPLDDETQEVSLEVDSTEDDLEAARVTRTVDLFKEDTLEFSEYRNYNRMELTVKSREDGISICRKPRKYNLRSR